VLIVLGYCDQFALWHIARLSIVLSLCRHFQTGYVSRLPIPSQRDRVDNSLNLSRHVLGWPAWDVQWKMLSVKPAWPGLTKRRRADVPDYGSREIGLTVPSSDPSASYRQWLPSSLPGLDVGKMCIFCTKHTLIVAIHERKLNSSIMETCEIWTCV